MPLNEYEPGTAFPGLIGRTTEESSPAWPRPLRADAGSPNVLFIGSTTSGKGSWAATAARSRRRTWTRWRPAACSTPTCTPRRCAPRPRSCIITGRKSPRQCHGRDQRARDRLPGLQRPDPVRERLLAGDAAAARLQHLHGRQVPPDAVGIRVGGRAVSTAGRSGAVSSASTGSLAGTPASGTRRLVYDNHQVEPPRTPRAGLPPDPRTWPTRPSRFIADAKQVAPHKPFFLHFCTGAGHAPHHVAKEWADQYAGQFDDGWDAYRERTIARQKELGVCRPTPGCPATTRTCRSGSPCPPTPAGWRRG